MKNKRAAIVLIFLASVAVYLNTINAPFIFDENTKIVKNPDIKKLTNITTRLIYPYSKNYHVIYRNDPSRPLTYLTFTFNYYFGKLNTFGYHLFNMFLHALNAILIFLLIRKIILLVFMKDAVLFPFLVALLFAVHPINTSAVSYVLGRSDLLATFFYMLSLLLFAEISEKKKEIFYLSLLSFLFGIASKQIAITLPALLFVFDYLFISNLKLENVLKRKRYHLPFWIIIVLYMLYRIAYLEGIGDLEAPGALWDRYSYVLIQPYVVLRYIIFMLVPAGMCFFHSLDYPAGIFEFRIPGSFIAVIGIFIYMYFECQKKTDVSKLIIFSLLWFFITLSPTSSFFPTTTPMVEYRLYLAGMGICILIVAAYYSIFCKGLICEGKSGLLIFITGVHIFVFGIITLNKNALYRDPVELWQEVISMYPSNTRAYNNLGTLYYERHEYSSAVQVYMDVLKIRPDYPEAHNTLGMIYDTQGKYNEALKEYLLTVTYKPDFVEAYINIGNIYSTKGEYDKASKAYQKAIEIDPNMEGIYYNMGIMYSKMKEFDRAAEEYKKALQINPDMEIAKRNLDSLLKYDKKYYDKTREYEEIIRKNPKDAQAHYNLGLLHKDAQEYDKSFDEFKKAVEISPDYQDAHNSLGNIYCMRKDYVMAIKEYKRVLELNPNYTIVHNNLGNVYYMRGEYDKALKEYQQVLKTAPDNINAHYNLGNLFYAQGNFERAAEEFHKTIDISPDCVIAYKSLGDLYYQLKDYKKAVQEYEQYLKLNPYDTEVSEKIKSIRSISR